MFNALGLVSKLWVPHPQYLSLGGSDGERLLRYRSLFEGHIEADLIADVRLSINQGLALGSEKFRKEIEELGGRRQNSLKRGPRPKAMG